MNDALYIAATGMQSQQLNVDTIANNLANASTPGFKRGRVNFQDLMYRESTAPAGIDAAETNGAMRGTGVSAGSLLKFFGAGELKASDNPMDVAIRGEGFIEVQLQDGTTGYWRGGTLQVTPEGWLATSDGALLKPQVQVGRDGKPWAVAADGRVTGSDRSGRSVDLGRLDVHVFSNPTGLKPLGGALYRSTEASGEPIAVRPGMDGAATLVQGAQEQSNVKLIDEMVNLMVAQRAYEMNVKVVQAADEMLGMSNNLRK